MKSYTVGGPQDPVFEQVETENVVRRRYFRRRLAYLLYNSGDSHSIECLVKNRPNGVTEPEARQDIKDMLSRGLLQLDRQGKVTLGDRFGHDQLY